MEVVSYVTLYSIITESHHFKVGLRKERLIFVWMKRLQSFIFDYAPNRKEVVVIE